ncbi:hypothetical protein N2152v2_010807 [Parachlorella kessleri]
MAAEIIELIRKNRPELQWTLPLPEHIEEVLDHGRALCIAFNPAGTLLASGCEEGEVVLWDTCTRGVARVYRGHRSPVVFVGWNPTGRHLVSASKDGRLVLWDVLSGEQLASQDCCCQDGAALVHACLDPHDEAELLVSASQGPAQFVNLRSGHRTPLPVFVLETKKRDARVTVVQAGQQQQQQGQADGAEAAAVQLAVLSACGQFIFAATKGTVAMLRRSDQALLDLVISIQGVTMMQHRQRNASESWLLLVGQDKAVKGYKIGTDSLQAAQPHDVGELQHVHEVPRFSSQAASDSTQSGQTQQSARRHERNPSLLRPEGPLLSLHRNFQDPQQERQPWSCAAFSPDMEHVAAGMTSKHAIVRWDVAYGDNEGTLEGKFFQLGCLHSAGKDSVTAMAWHPKAYPMQLYTVGSNGVISIWTTIEQESWHCFAPDFTELAENREYREREDEFDLNPRPEDEEMVAEEGTDEELDIVGRHPSGNSAQGSGDGGDAANPAPGDAEAQLLHLPVTVADIREALQREQQPAAAGPAQPPPQPGQQGGAEARQGDAGAGVAGKAGGGQGGVTAAGRQGSEPPSEHQQNGGGSLSEGASKRKRSGS